MTFVVIGAYRVNIRGCGFMCLKYANLCKYFLLYVYKFGCILIQTCKNCPETEPCKSVVYGNIVVLGYCKPHT